MNLSSFYKTKLQPLVNDANVLAEQVGLLPIKIYLFVQFTAISAVNKISYGFHAPEWFAGLDFPYPQRWLPADVNWNMAIAGELLLPALLFFKPTRKFAALGLLYVLFMAVYTVHFDLGWAGWDTLEADDGTPGFKIPLVYALLVWAVLVEKKK